MFGDGIFDGDADLETAEFEAAGQHAAALRKKGICSHGWTQDQPDGRVRCLDCGQMFADADAHQAERDEVLC